MSALIFGAGKHGKVVLEILQEQGYSVNGWLDDDPRMWGRSIRGLPVLGNLEYLRLDRQQPGQAIVAVGYTAQRVAISRALEELGVELLNAVHPSAVIMRSAAVGRGNCICAGVVLGVDTRVMNYAVINTGCTIDHDSLVEDGAYLAPGVRGGGCVTIRKGAYVSTGATLVAGVSIGEGAVVGAGAVVTTHIPPAVLAYGVPARIIRPIDSSFDWTRLLAGVPPAQRIES